jgi:ketosteroid isomerase-like protein
MDPDMKIRVCGDVAVAINRATIKEKYSGKATAGQFHSSLVFAKMSTGWQLVCNQINPITSP